MADLTCNKPQTDHEEDITQEISDEVETVSLSQAPSEQKRLKNGENGKEKEKEKTSKESIQRGKSSPLKPDLPPRPIGLSSRLSRTPPKRTSTPTPPPVSTSPLINTRSLPPHSPPSTQILSPKKTPPPQPLPFKRTAPPEQSPPTTQTPSSSKAPPAHPPPPNQIPPSQDPAYECHLSPKPKRPSQPPSHQRSIKATTRSQERPKSPEVTKATKTISYKTENEMKGNESDINTTKNNEELQKKVAPGRPQRPLELNTGGDKGKPEQQHGAEAPDQKKLNRPPRPGLPRTNKKDDSKIDKSKYPEEKSPLMPKEEGETTALEDTQESKKPDQIADAGVPAKSNRPVKRPRITDAHEHEINKSPNLNRVEKTHELKLSVEKPSRPPSLRERPATAHSTQDKKADVSKSSHNQFCENSKPCKLVRPPPPNKHVQDNTRLTKPGGEHKKTFEETHIKKAGKEQKPRVFRVHSLTKTEVESFNKETFSIKPRKDEKNVGRAHGKDIGVKPRKLPPAVFPKPPRPHLPPQCLKSSNVKDESEKAACKEIEESGRKKESRAEDAFVKKGIPGDIEREFKDDKGTLVENDQLRKAGGPLGIAGENLHQVITTTVGSEVQEAPLADVVNKLEKKSENGTKTLPETSKVERADNAVEEKRNDEEKKVKSTNERCLEEKSAKNGEPQQQEAVSQTEGEDNKGREDKRGFNNEKYLASEDVVIETENEEKKDDETVKRTFNIGKYLADEDNACKKVTDSSPKDEESDMVGKQGVKEQLALCEEHHEVDKRDVDNKKDLAVVEKENDTEATEENNDLKEVLKIFSKPQSEEEIKGQCPSVELNKTNMVECLKFEMNLDEPNETEVGNEAVNSKDDDKEGLHMKEVAWKDVEGSVDTETKVSTSEHDKNIRDDTGSRGINGIGGNLVEETCSNSEGIVRTEGVSESEVLCGPSASLQSSTHSQLPENDKSTVLVAHEICVEESVSKSDKSLEPTVKVCVQSPKNKNPPPKPCRTSSLKRDFRPLINTSAESQEEIQEIPEEKLIEESSPQVQVGSDGDQIVSSESTPKSPKDPPMSPPTRSVTFEDDVETKETSLPDRSKSFSSAAKRRSVDGTKETTAATKSEPGGMGVTRSFSFGGVMKRRKNPPPRPSPPTFFVEPSQTSDSTVTEEENEQAGSNEKSEVVISLEQEETAMKHDSLTLENITDSESESDKEELPLKSKTFYISREILSTERSFVGTLKLISEDFIEAVKIGTLTFSRSIIPEETLQEILLNISQIYDFDREFLNALEERMESWDDLQRIGDIIKTFSHFLKLYKTYIHGYDNAMAVLSESLKKYPQFAEIVREFECKKCQNLTIGMYMLKPIQRIPSYRLLLKDYLKHLSEDSLDHKDVSDALAIVSDVATHINEDMKRVDKFEEVLRVQRSLVGQVGIVEPGRDLVKEGVLMKLCRKDMQPRMFYLFTDVLLYTTPVANSQFRLNLSLPLEEIKVEIPSSSDFDNEFSIISTKKSFTLSASTAEERDEWLEALRNVSDEIRKKKETFILSKRENMEALEDSLQDGQDTNVKLGSKAPVWIPDSRVTMCMLCTDGFTVTNRRHHCRACGKVVCGSCSSNSAALPYLNKEAARVCDNCYEVLSNDTNSAPKVTTNDPESVDALEKAQPLPWITSNSQNQKSVKKPTQRKIEVPASEHSTISGYLNKRKGKKWQKLWYVVKDNVLYACKASSDVVALETCPLLGYEVTEPQKMDGDDKKIVFQLIHAGTKPVVLLTDNIKSAKRWVTALRRATMLTH